jgi:hypothetical protein
MSIDFSATREATNREEIFDVMNGHKIRQKQFELGRETLNHIMHKVNMQNHFEQQWV